MANAFQAVDYTNPTYYMAETGVVVCRPFTAIVNSAGSNVTTLGVGDTIALCGLPGSNFGITILDYFIDFAKIDTNAVPTLVMSLGLALTSLDPNQTSAAAAGAFATLITPNTATDTRLTPSAYLSNAATPVLLPVTYPVGALPFSITNQSGGVGAPAGLPNAGLYDFSLSVTAAAATVSAVAAYIQGWIKYQTIGQAPSR